MTSTTVRPADAGVGGPGDRRDGRALPALLWLLATAVASAAAAAVPVLFDRRFYFVDDTQTGAVGIWYRLGANLVHGHLPALIDPVTWQSGNLPAEGQWGLWNPLVLLIGLATYLTGDLALVATVVKIAGLVVAALGTHLLVRSYRVPHAWCSVAAVAVTTGGFTVYVDSASWVTGMFVWALLPWAWVALRRVVLRRANPLPAFVAGYLLVSVGYVHGVIALAFVFVAVLVSALRDGSRAGAVRVLGVGVLVGLVTVTVFLPGLLTAPVTNRSATGVLNDGQLTVDATDLLSGAFATGDPELRWFRFYTGLTVPAPLFYLSWVLPLLALVDWSAARRLLRTLTDQLVVLVLMLAFVLGPSSIGPLRFPVRLVPYVVSTAVVITVVLLVRAPALARPVPAEVADGAGAHRRRSALRDRRLLGALALLVASAYLSWRAAPGSTDPQLTPGRALVHFYLPALAVSAVAVGVVGALLRRRPARPRRTGAAAGVALLATLGLTVVQHAEQPRPAFVDWGSPAHASAYASQLTTAEGDVLVVGSTVDTLRAPAIAQPGYTAPSAVFGEAAIANNWLIGGQPVQNTYTTIGYAGFTAQLCINWRGDTCPALLRRLFVRQPVTGQPLARDLSVSTLLVFRSALTASGVTGPPSGWHQSAADRYTVTWVRDTPLPRAGGVTWSSAGTAVTELSGDDTSVRLRVDAVPASGGRVALSRLAWPGYQVSGATLGAPVRGYLLTVDLPAGSSGHVVTVRFVPPGWTLEVAAWIAALACAALWSLAALVLSWRRRRA